MELDISDLRKQKRPLWMSELDLEANADMLGGGGDLYTDRLPLDWPRGGGEESADLSEEELTQFLLEGRSVGEDYPS